MNDDSYFLLGIYHALYENKLSNELIVKFVDESLELNEDFVETNQDNVFFAASTEPIRKIGVWDGRLKFYGEDLFWFNCYYNDLKIGFTNKVSINSLRYLPLSYFLFRFRPKKI